MKKIFSSFISFDSLLCAQIYKLSGRRYIDYIFYGVSKFGDGWLYGISVILYLIFKTKEALTILPAVVASFTIESIIYMLIKKNVKRIRPFKTIENITSLIIPPDEFSFPSGHTAAAAVFTVLCGTVYPSALPYMIFFTSAVGFSRVYNGVHYPGDVFVGAGLGVISAKAGLFLFY